MARVKRGATQHKRHKKILKLAKGYRSVRSTNHRRALEAVMKAGRQAFADRRKKKRDFRGLWIIRLNAAVRNFGMSYSAFVSKMKEKKVGLNRKILSELAIHEPKTFESIVKHVK